MDERERTAITDELFRALEGHARVLRAAGFLVEILAGQTGEDRVVGRIRVGEARSELLVAVSRGPGGAYDARGRLAGDDERIHASFGPVAVLDAPAARAAALGLLDLGIEALLSRLAHPARHAA